MRDSSLERLIKQLADEFSIPKAVLRGAVDRLGTEARIVQDVMYGRALPETLIPRKRNRLDVTVTRADGTVRHLRPAFNARVDAGANQQAVLLGSAAGNPFKYMALSANSLTILKGDTTLSGEISANGCARALGTYGSYTAPSTLSGAASYQISKVFTCATAAQSVVSAALFDAATVGNMFVEANLSVSVSLQVGDSLTITWTISI